MSPAYTHTFIFQCGDQDISGNMEFNTDGRASYETNTKLTNFDVAESRRFTALVEELKRIYDTYEGISLIRIKKIE